MKNGRQFSAYASVCQWVGVWVSCPTRSLAGPCHSSCLLNVVVTVHQSTITFFFSVHSGSHCYKITSGWHDAIMMTRDDVLWQVQDTTVTLLGREVLPMGISGWNTTQSRCARRREVMVNIRSRISPTCFTASCAHVLVINSE